MTVALIVGQSLMLVLLVVKIVFDWIVDTETDRRLTVQGEQIQATQRSMATLFDLLMPIATIVYSGANTTINSDEQSDEERIAAIARKAIQELDESNE